MKIRYFLSTLMLFVMALILPLSLKAQKVETHVTSFGTYDFSGKHFCILSNMENISSDDLEFKEYAKYISYAFQMKGGIEVSSQSEEVEVCVLLSYDLKDASYVRTISEPVWGKTGVRSVTSTTNSLGTQYYYHYDYGVVGYNQTEKKIDLYNGYIDLFVYEISTKDDDGQKMIWKANAKSEGKFNNLFKIFPCMVFTLYNSIGWPTEDDWARFSTDDWSVNAFKQGEYNSKNVTFLPATESERYITSYAADEAIFSIWQVSRNTDFTRIIISILPRYKIKLYKNTYIKYNGKEFKWENAFFLDKNGDCERSFSMGKRQIALYWDYLCIDFPPLPEDVYVFDLISQKKKDKTSKDDLIWKGIQLRNW